jgi:hypothetical protein
VTAPVPPPPPPAGPPGYPGAPGAEKPQNIFGILALVLGIVSVVLFCVYAGFWAGIPAIVLGVLGLNRAKAGRATNRGLALTGLILGAVGLLISIGVLVFAIAFGDKITNYADCVQKANGDQKKTEQCAKDFGK